MGVWLWRGRILRHNIFNSWSCKNGLKTPSRSSSSVPVVYKVFGKKLNKNGDDVPIIILHGLLGNKRNWQSMAKKIENSTNRTVITVDQRNHGESPHTPSHTYLDLAEDINQLMNTLPAKKAIVIGHSMGGRAAMALALTQPTKVKGLVVVDITPVSFPSIENNFFLRLMGVMKSLNFANQNLTTAKRNAANAIKSSGIVNDGPTLNFILTNVGMRNGKVVWNCNVHTLTNYWDTIAMFPSELKSKKYAGPTLFVAGRKSHFVQDSDLQKIQVIFPHAKLIFLADAGHNVHQDKPDELLSLLRQFIKVISLRLVHKPNEQEDENEIKKFYSSNEEMKLISP